MDKNRLSETFKNPQGQTQQTEESVQDLYGQAKDAAGEVIHAVGECPAPWRTPFATTSKIDRIPTAAIALALGWLIGRSNRPF
jgi:hypothetical protein